MGKGGVVKVNEETGWEGTSDSNFLNSSSFSLR